MYRALCRFYYIRSTNTQYIAHWLDEYNKKKWSSHLTNSATVELKGANGRYTSTYVLQKACKSLCEMGDKTIKAE